jgi:hypothetical protein
LTTRLAFSPVKLLIVMMLVGIILTVSTRSLLSLRAMRTHSAQFDTASQTFVGPRHGGARVHPVGRPAMSGLRRGRALDRSGCATMSHRRGTRRGLLPCCKLSAINVLATVCDGVEGGTHIA